MVSTPGLSSRSARRLSVNNINKNTECLVGTTFLMEILFARESGNERQATRDCYGCRGGKAAKAIPSGSYGSVIGLL